MTDEPEPITAEELDELLAEITGMSVEELREASEEIDIGPPWEGEVVNDEDTSES